jgi:class 3 adenylate cyclase
MGAQERPRPTRLFRRFVSFQGFAGRKSFPLQRTAFAEPCAGQARLADACSVGGPRPREPGVQRLAIVEAAPKFVTGAGTPLHVRVGIATGLVVVGDLIGSGDGVRLQSQCGKSRLLIVTSQNNCS